MENQPAANFEKPSIFRRKALDRISSPEELDQYLTVTGPGVWLPLIAVIVLLIGAIIWMIFGQINVTVNVAVVANNGSVVCYVPNEQKDSAVHSGTVTITGTAYPLSDVGYAMQLITEDTDTSIRIAGSLAEGALTSPLKVDAKLDDGVYSGIVTVEAIHPIKYIIN